MSKYSRAPLYGRPPRWDRLYSRYFPKHTDGCSRHVGLIAAEFRSIRSPIRRWLIDEGYEPDHMAESLEATVKMLWETRAKLAAALAVRNAR